MTPALLRPGGPNTTVLQHSKTQIHKHLSHTETVYITLTVQTLIGWCGYLIALYKGLINLPPVPYVGYISSVKKLHQCLVSPTKCQHTRGLTVAVLILRVTTLQKRTKFTQHTKSPSSRYNKSTISKTSYQCQQNKIISMARYASYTDSVCESCMIDLIMQGRISLK